MHALYFTLCLVAVTASPARNYKRLTERKLELTTQAKIEEPAKLAPVDKKDLPGVKKDLPGDKKDLPGDKKEIPDEVANLRAYYENHSVNVVSSTSATFVEEDDKQYQVDLSLPDGNKRKPQINIVPVQPQPQPYKKPMKGPMQSSSMCGENGDEYTINVYVNFPPENGGEYDDYDCYEGKCWGKSKCKEGQMSVKGVCVDRH